MYRNLPIEIVNIILDYDGRIKYRDGKYTDQINTQGKKYQTVKQNIINKLSIKKQMSKNGNNFYLDIPLNKELGVIYDNKWYGGGFMVSFYKNKRNTLLNQIYEFFNSVKESYFITNHEYE